MSNTTTETKIKFGYLTYDDMLLKIESGEINEYDIIYTKDRLATYVISEELKPIELRARVYIFSSVQEAETSLNVATDTYIGQIVSIKYKDKYRGYIVNQNNSGFYVTPLDEHPDTIDYNTLGNKPITNLTSTLDDFIIVSDLDTGLYSINGQYKIASNDVTTYVNPNYCLFIVDKSNDNTTIKKISSTEIIDYVVNDTTTKVNQIVTSDYLESKGYATTSYVDEKIAALDFITKEEATVYIKEIIESSLDDILDERIDAQIDKKIQSASAEQINSLFA